MIAPTICTIEGFLLRSLRYGDTSRVATLFSKELGKISIIAKGARVPGSPFGASLDLFTFSQFVVYYRPGRNLQMLKSGDVEHQFTGMTTEPRRFTLGCAILEFLDRILLEDESAPGLFALALRALVRVDRVPLPTAAELFRAFQLRAAALLGYALQLESCLHCGASLPEAALRDLGGTLGDEPSARSTWLFRAPEGGALCPGCAPSAGTGYPMTPRALLRLRTMVVGSPEPGQIADPSEDYLGSRLLRSRPGSSSFASGDPASDAVRQRWHRTLEGLVEDFLRFHVEQYRGLRSLGSWEERGQRSKSYH